MPRQPRINWRQSDRETISRTVQQFNAKITRVLKKNPEFADFLPERLNVRDFSAQIETRQDFNRLVKSARRFIKPGAEMPVMSETGIATTLWEKRELRYANQRIARARSEAAKKANVSTYKGTMGTIRANNLQPRNSNIDTIPASSWEQYLESTRKQDRANYMYDRAVQYKADYLRNVREKIWGGPWAKTLFDFVSTLDSWFMYDRYYDDPVLQINYISDPAEAEIIAQNAYEHWIEAAGYYQSQEVDVYEEPEDDGTFTV